MIKGGYYIKARVIQDSEIAHAAPCVREIWDYLLREANHEDYKNISRGQLMRSVTAIQEALCWFAGYRKMTYSLDQCENAMKWLRSHEMITTTKTTRGVIITVCKYEYYQNQKNYENRTGTDEKTAMLPESHRMIYKHLNTKKKVNTPTAPVAPLLELKTDLDEHFIKFNQWLQTNAPVVLKMKQPITLEQYKTLKEEFNTVPLKKLLFQMLEEMQNWAKINTKTSAFLTVRNWAKKQIDQNPALYQNKNNEPGKSTQQTAREAQDEKLLSQFDPH